MSNGVAFTSGVASYDSFLKCHGQCGASGEAEGRRRCVECVEGIEPECPCESRCGRPPLSGPEMPGPSQSGPQPGPVQRALQTPEEDRGPRFRPRRTDARQSGEPS